MIRAQLREDSPQLLLVVFIGNCLAFRAAELFIDFLRTPLCSPKKILEKYILYFIAISCREPLNVLKTQCGQNV